MLGFDGACGLGVGAFKQAERGLCHSCLTLSFPGTLLVPFLAVLPIMVRLRWLHFYLCRLCPQPPDPYIVGKLRLSAFCEFDDWEDDAAANVWVTFGANGKNLRGWEMMESAWEHFYSGGEGKRQHAMWMSKSGWECMHNTSDQRVLFY
jgi:hypothetical protein